MPDIRQRVEEDRGLLKKIQMVIPGYRGYRIREDLRDSDKMLRMELAKKLALQRKQLEESREEIVQSMPMSKSLVAIGGVISQYKKVEGVMVHSDSGYSGFAADVQFKQEEMNQLYDYDISILENIQFIDQAIGELRSAITGEQDAEIKSSVKAVKMRLTGLEEKFAKRQAVISGTGL
ncbi:MAG: hypothetical protein A4E32_01451 [Methanomassiliicoccales archaeon PtaU1.Bin124]|nr:MAG: hypothetical protein A4E32_01451 [Methanomassiliicoccales archaeon PtaU1.Bin124]